MAQAQGGGVPACIVDMQQAADVEALAETPKGIGVHKTPAEARSAATIKVKTLTGSEIEVEVEQTEPVGRIKRLLQEKQGIPPEQQRLIFDGKQLDDGKTLSDSNVRPGPLIHLVLALRGGGCVTSQ